MPLDPQAQAVLDQALDNGAPPITELSPAQAREAYRQSRLPTQPEPLPVEILRDFDVLGSHGPVPVREYRPLGSRQDAMLPALIYFHGGGWVVGDRNTHDTLCRELCNLAACSVFSVDYHMGPEFPFPAAVDDALSVTRWLSLHAREVSIDAGRLAVGGDSAGGNLAATVALALRDESEIHIACQLLIYPATDMRFQTPSYRQYAQGYLLTEAAMTYFRGHYVQDPASYNDWRASPLLADDHSGLPPTLVITAGFDPLKDDGRLYADKLSSAGGAVQHTCFEHQMHGFVGMGKMIDEANTAVRLCADWLKRHL